MLPVAVFGSHFVSSVKFTHSPNDSASGTTSGLGNSFTRANV